jgi:hypothetical protein
VGREIQKWFWWGDRKEKINLKDLGLYRRIILYWILKPKVRKL